MVVNWRKKQKTFVTEQFAKLVKNFLTEDEQKLVQLDFNLIDWQKMDVQAWGLTRYNNYTGTMKVAIRYHQNYEELLDTISHEFAHVYLNLRDTVYHSCEDLKHKIYNHYFLNYLKENL